MQRLDQLIYRLLHPKAVSNEDVLDDIQKYWDEAANTVKGYWNDTDTEMAEEIGVSKPSLAQLLDDHSEGFPYANLGGKSGIASYNLGEDWILINFTTGAKYLYTHKSAPPEQITQMKQLAHAGKGLNSYIMRTLKDGYAGRNVKGDLVIRPGMERYSREANKRLQLLYAFRNTVMTTVSNEGVFDAIKRLFGAKKSKDSGTQSVPTQQPAYEYIWDKADKIEKNPPHQLTEFSSNSPIFQMNGTYNPNWLTRLDNDLKQYDRIVKELSNYDKKVAAWKNKWDDRLDEFVGDADRADEFLEAVKGFVREQPKSWADVFRNNYEFIGYGKYRWGDNTNIYGFSHVPMTPAGSVTIPTMDAQRTKQVVAMIGKLGKMVLFGMSEDLTFASYDFTDPPFRGYFQDNRINELLNQVWYNSDTAVAPMDHCEVVESRLEEILKVLVTYVLSAQSEAIGNEVYAETTGKKYLKQIDQAGPDGLDKVSRQFMNVGLTSFSRKSTIGLESSDPVQLVPSTEDLLSKINQLYVTL